jgi:hypothetical protein
MGTWRILREYLIYLELFLELFSLEFPRHRDFDHNTRVDLVNKRDAPSPDIVYIRELALDIHGRRLPCDEEAVRRKEQLSVFQSPCRVGGKRRDIIDCDWFHCLLGQESTIPPATLRLEESNASF